MKYPYWPTVIIFTMLSPHISHRKTPINRASPHTYTHITYIHIYIFIKISPHVPIVSPTYPNYFPHEFVRYHRLPIPSMEWGLWPHFQTQQPSCSGLIIYIYISPWHIFIIFRLLLVIYLFVYVFIHLFIHLFIYLFISIYTNHGINLFLSNTCCVNLTIPYIPILIHIYYMP